MTDIIFAAIITISVFVGIVYVLTRTGKDESMRNRLDRMAGDEGFDASVTDNHNPETAFLEQDSQKTGLAAFGESIIKLTGQDLQQKEKEMQLQFIQAGIYTPNALGNYYAFRAIAIPIAIFMAYSFFTTPAEGAMKLVNYGAAIGVLFFSWFGAKMYISNAKQKRQKVLQRSFPDTLDLILVCVESGLALDAALARVCRELGRAHPEITKELNRTRMELTLLSDRSIALQNLAERTDLVAFRSLVAALMQTEKFGTSLTETLRVLSDDYRHNRLMMAENKAGRLPALMTIPMILLMMPAFVMIILGPGIIEAMKAFQSME